MRSAEGVVDARTDFAQYSWERFDHALVTVFLLITNTLFAGYPYATSKPVSVYGVYWGNATGGYLRLCNEQVWLVEQTANIRNHPNL